METNRPVHMVLADVHNILSEIKVSGEDAIRMAQALVTLRNLVSQKAEEEKQNAKQ